MRNKIFEKLKEVLPEAQKNVPLKDYTTYKIGGPAEYFFIAKSKDDLIKAAKAAKSLKLSLFVLGGGSNILASDKGAKGLVVKIQTNGIKIENENPAGKVVYAEAGATLNDLVSFCAQNSLAGAEWAAGIPGTVGGAIFGSAQAFGGKMTDAVKSVSVFNTKTFEIKNFLKSQCGFSLKNSIFKKNKNLLIVSALLQFENGSRQEIAGKIAGYLKYRKNGQPLSCPSAGCVFVNPEKKIKNKNLLEKFPEFSEFNKKGAIPAGYLIQKAGLAGKKIGKAQISQKHSNFIINLGGAKAKDVLSLINMAKQKVKKVFGVSLIAEVQLLGF